jgi:hypothetical protein
MDLAFGGGGNMLPARPLQTFISYSRVNQQFALRLAGELKSAGFSVWMDQFDIPTGSRWDDEIEKALRESQIFLFIMTPASIASENAKDEVGYAIDHGKRILPVLLEECEIPLRLRRLQYVDFTKKSFDEGIASAKQLLSKLADEARKSPPKVVEPAYETSARKKSTRVANEPKTKPTPKRVEPSQNQFAAKRKGRASPRLRTAIIGIGVIGILILIFAASNPEQTPIVSSPITHTPAPTQTAIPTETTIPPTMTIMPTEVPRSFMENFHSNEQFTTDWTHALRHGNAKKESNFKFEIRDESLVVDLNSEYIWAYFFHQPSVDYSNVQLEAIVSELNSEDTFGLICQFSNQGWYEFDVNGGGKYEVRYVSSTASTRDEDQYRIDYGAIDGFKYSLVTPSENTIRVICNGNLLSLFVNDKELMKDFPSRFKLQQGEIGFAVRSNDLYPVHVVMKSITVTEPQE